MSEIQGYSGWYRCTGGGFFVDFRACAVSLTESELRLLLERVEASLDRAVDRITHVRVRLVDVNGPKRGLDKRCSVQVRLAKHDTIEVSSRAETIWAALSSSLGAVQRRCHERLARARGRRRARRLAAVR